MKHKIAVISCSLNKSSRSRILAQQAAESLSSLQAEVEFIDLQKFELPFCDGGSAYGDSNVIHLTKRITEMDAVLLAVPIYNYYANAAAKNLIELTGKAWEDKVVGFLAAAGGHSSYMSTMSLANQLMLDFRCLVVPRFVYATGSDFGPGADGGESIIDDKIASRVDELAETTFKLAGSLNISGKQ